MERSKGEGKQCQLLTRFNILFKADSLRWRRLGWRETAARTLFNFFLHLLPRKPLWYQRPGTKIRRVWEWGRVSVGCACVRVSVREHLIINSMHNTFVYSSISLSLSQKLNPTSQKFSSARTFWCQLLSLSFSFSPSLCLSHFYLSIFWHKSEKFPDVELQSVRAEASCGTLLGDNVITFSQGQRDKC